MNEFVRGPFLALSVIVFIAGLIYRTVRLFMLTDRKTPAFCPVSNPKNSPVASKSEEERKLEKIARFQNSVIGKHPVMTLVSTGFHVCLLATPVFLMAHNQVLHSCIGIRLPSMPDGLADSMTVVVLACALLFLVRRIAVPKVAAISSVQDYAALFITVVPFLTGFLAYHQVSGVKFMSTLHIFTGELMLIAVPFTKVGHMVFFFFARLTMAGEYCLGRGSRIWST